MRTKEKAGHTQGPWKVDGVWGNTGFRIATSASANENLHIAGVDGRGYEQNEANARLIAAAPELLKAAKEMYRVLREDEKYMSYNPVCKKAELAIARATNSVA